jgi:hypothetical protein
MTKTCKKCSETKDLTFFTTDPSRKSGMADWCKRCKANVAAYYRKLDPEKFRRRERNQLTKLKAKVHTAYGNKCACPPCGETMPQFLSIDHKNNDGNKQRLKLFGRNRGGAAQTLYRYIIKNNFPSDLQLLCYNCNNGKRWNNGICPHNVSH